MRRPREKGEQVFRRLFSAASRFDGLEEGEQKTKREGYWNVVADVEGQSFVAGPGGANAFSQSKEHILYPDQTHFPGLVLASRAVRRDRDSALLRVRGEEVCFRRTVRAAVKEKRRDFAPPRGRRAGEEF